jgi:hypothetical protein
LAGTVLRGPYGTGSKSERQAIWLETAEGKLVLRRKVGPAFDDRTLEKYVGKRVSCGGLVVDNTLIAERIDIVK